MAGDGPAAGHGLIAVRDSKDRGGPALVFTAGQWRAFAAGIRDGSLGWPSRWRARRARWPGAPVDGHVRVFLAFPNRADRPT